MGRNVMMHCSGGSHRAGAAAMGYLMHSGGYTRRQASKWLLSTAPALQPASFCHLDEALRRYSEYCMGSMDEALHARLPATRSD